MSNWLPVSSRGRNIFFGAPALLVAFVSLINVRPTLAFLIAVLLFLLATAAMRGDTRAAIPELDLVTVSVGILILYAAVSALWAPQPFLALGKTAAAAGIALSGFAAMGLLAREPSAHVRPMALGFWIGFLLGLVLFLFEVASGQALKIWLINALNVGPDILSNRFMVWDNGKLIAFDITALNRDVTAVTVLIWPVLMAAQATLARRWRAAAAALFLGVAIVAVVLARHATSIAAIVAGLAVFAAAYKARRVVFYALSVAWILSCLAVVPAAWLSYRLDLHNAPWLKESAQHRIAIWNNAGDQVLKAPLIGHGANMYDVVRQDIEKTLPRSRFPSQLALHPHNIFLQVWFELGLVGALLLTMTGLSVLWRISVLGAPQQPYAYATLAAFWMYFLAGYGLWQVWYMALAAFAAVGFALGRRAMEQAGAVQSVDAAANGPGAPQAMRR